jgi:predicted DNA-binding protein
MPRHLAELPAFRALESLASSLQKEQAQTAYSILLETAVSIRNNVSSRNQLTSLAKTLTPEQAITIREAVLETMQSAEAYTTAAYDMRAKKDTVNADIMNASLNMHIHYLEDKVKELSR